MISIFKILNILLIVTSFSLLKATSFEEVFLEAIKKKNIIDITYLSSTEKFKTFLKNTKYRCNALSVAIETGDINTVCVIVSETNYFKIFFIFEKLIKTLSKSITSKKFNITEKILNNKHNKLSKEDFKCFLEYLLKFNSKIILKAIDTGDKKIVNNFFETYKKFNILSSPEEFYEKNSS